VLDLGCGDGRISAELADTVFLGAVLGVDASPRMIDYARAKHLGGRPANLDFAVADATHLAFSAQFDLVVSFNCLHWIPDQLAVLAGITRALKPGGRMFLHFAGKGNVAGMQAVVEEVSARSAWRANFTDFTFSWCHPDAASYRRLIEEVGLVPERVGLYGTIMLHGGAPALAGWLRTTWLPYLDRLPEDRREVFIDEVVAAYLTMRPCDEQGRIWVDAVRLEAEGHRAGTRGDRGR